MVPGFWPLNDGCFIIVQLKLFRHCGYNDSPLMGVWSPPVSIVGGVMKASKGTRREECTAGYDNKIPASEKYLSTKL
jgi:hypothetical protein